MQKRPGTPARGKPALSIGGCDVATELHSALGPFLFKREVLHRVRDFWLRPRRFGRSEGVDN